MESEIKSVVIIGPAYPLRGGLASYDERLAREFNSLGYDTTIYTFSFQYPSFLFPGKTQFSTEKPPDDLKIKAVINSVNPLNWISVGNELKKAKPDVIVVRYWLPFMGPCLGTILRRVKKNKHTQIVCIADNVIPHEKRPGDEVFTKYFFKPVDRFITMSEKVLEDLKKFAPQKPARFISHPLYDNFGEKLTITSARQHLDIPNEPVVFLFFGFIRKYKGLDLLLEAIKILMKKNIQKDFKVMIAGEFYEDEKNYAELLNDPQIKSHLILKTQFIADSEVKYYLSAADCVVQPYRNATQSGVTPLAYHFEVPMIVTNVGGLPSLVPDGKAGLIAEPNPPSIAEKMQQLLNLGKEHFLPGLQDEKKKYSWKNLVDGILGS